MKIAFLGDIALFGKYCLVRNNDLHRQFREVAEYLATFDLVVANLETPFVNDERPRLGKSATIQSDPGNVDLLKFLSVTHVTLANNHIGDFGRSAYERTKKCLDSAGIGWFGTEGKKIEIIHDGEKIALLGYCSYNTNPSPVDSGKKTGLHYLDADNVRRELKNNHDKDFLSILSVHSGQEHVHMPSSEDVFFARSLAKDFNYVYYGHHPHVVQGREDIDGSAIFYSLGNFVFDDVYTPRDLKNPLIRLSESNKTGVIGIVEICNGEIINSDVTPIYLGQDKVLIGLDVKDFNMFDYNKKLVNAGTTDYDSERAVIISEYIKSRRELRNAKWYFKRFNLNSILIILYSKINSILYRKNFISKL